MRRIALVTILAFGCATVRVPAGAPAEPLDATGPIAPPVVELWLESSGDVPEEVAAAAEADARAALTSALATQRIDRDALGAGSAVLFARERAVALTDARRSQQTWAKVGIVAGAVVVVAALVTAFVLRGKGASPASVAKQNAVPNRTAPVAVRPIPVHPAAPVRAGPFYYGPRFPIFFGFTFWLPPRPLVLEPAPDSEDPWWTPDPPPPFAPGEEAMAQSEPPPPDEDEPIPGVTLELPPLDETVSFPVDDRGFFAGPHTALQLDLLDRSTGRLLWSKAVSTDEDPRDARAIAALVREALAGQRWAIAQR